jgi:hypothetical protein
VAFDVGDPDVIPNLHKAEPDLFAAEGDRATGWHVDLPYAVGETDGKLAVHRIHVDHHTV